MKAYLRRFSVMLIVLAVTFPTFAEDQQAAIERLENRVAELERRVAELEVQLGPVIDAKREATHRETLKQRARERMRQDADHYTPEQMREAEALYKVAGKHWNTPQAIASLEKLVKMYPKANRTGCALLYLGQMSEGEKKIAYLRDAIENHGDCFYGNGVQVGAYARYKLAFVYEQAGDTEKALKLRDELHTQFSGAIDHRGNRLTTAASVHPAATQPTTTQPTEMFIPDEAIQAAATWIELVDTGRYARSWEDAAGAFRKSVKQDAWQASLRAGRSPLGKLVSREIKSKTFHTSLPNAPAGQYVVIVYKTAFEHKAEASETITPMLDADGQWRISGYFIE